MKDTIQIVELNDFEIGEAYKMAEYIRRLGKSFKWKRDIVAGHVLKYSVDEASDTKVVVSGMIGAPSFRLIIKGPHVSFSTVNSDSPNQLFYDFCHILAIEINEAGKLLRPGIEIFEGISTNIRDYYLVNSEDSASISANFERGIREKTEKDYISGMFYIHLSSTEFGNELGIRAAKAFAESSHFDHVGVAFVCCRGRGVPIFYADGGVYYPLAEKEYCESIQKDFTRIFFKMITKKNDIQISTNDRTPSGTGQSVHTSHTNDTRSI